jgi:AcrR family transcriptional regulator
VSRSANRTSSTRKADETRRRILEAALAQFAERGFEETTMRQIAERAGVAAGATYYYFASKDELVLEFYRESQRQAEGVAAERLGPGRDLESRLSALLFAKFEQFAPQRAMLGALFRSAANPASAVSPFGESTRDIRESAIELFRQAIEGSSTRVPRDLAPHLPRLLWLYQMGLILFWIYDDSEGQWRTRRLTEVSLDLVVKLIRISRFPLLRPARASVVELLSIFEPGSGPQSRSR